MRLYLRVTDDKYELPIAVADTQAELARMLGLSKNNVQKMFMYARRDGGRGRMYKVVDVDDID